MSGRAAEPVEIPPACPFLAFEDDREHRSTVPDHRHRCYAETRPAPRAVAHQERYCLTSDFPSCPTFQAWARREAAREAGPDTPHAVPAGRPPTDPAAWLRDDAAAAAAAGGVAAATGQAGAAGSAQLGAFDTLDARSAGDAELAALVAGGSRDAAPGVASQQDEGGEGGEPPAFLAGRTASAAGTRSGRSAGTTAGSPAGAASATSQEGGSAPLDPDAPSWEPPRRYEAYPTLRIRSGLPSIPPAALALVALVLAAVVLFLLPGFLAGPSSPPAGSGSPSTSASGAGSAAPTTPAAPTPVVYVVKTGDTLTSIARKYGLTVDDLLAANPQIKDPNKIKVGDQITIPTPGSSPAATASSAAP